LIFVQAERPENDRLPDVRPQQAKTGQREAGLCPFWRPDCPGVRLARHNGKTDNYESIVNIGYIRISTIDQTEALQRDALKYCDRIFFEVASGVKADRVELERAIASLRKGDTFTVWRLDRLGRSTRHLLECIDEIEAVGANFVSWVEGFDTSTPSGRLFFTIAAGFAEFERHLIIERTKAGLAAARARGNAGGRRRALSNQEIKTAKILREHGQTVREICETLAIGRTTYYEWCHDRDRN
jgi:DNA invertase Pin-like site-specific DNA recombinase